MSDRSAGTRAPTLVIELPEGLREVALGETTTLGRGVGNDVTIDHPTVSRNHARISRLGDSWRFEDVGSRNGTRGGVTPGLPFDLVDGAAIRIGRVRAWFFASGMPANWSPPEHLPTDGRLVRCRCGHVGWAPSFVSGLSVRCRRCKRQIAVVDETPSAGSASATCAACRDAVGPGQPSHTCPSCGATMHADCRAELRGCATYGCERVNELATSADAPAASSTPDEPLASRGGDGWTLATLGLVGLPLFGLPALGWAAFGLRRGARRAALLAAIGLGAAGIVASSLAWPRLWSAGGAAW